MNSIVTVLLMFATWSSVFSIGKIALQYCPPLFLTGARMLLAGIGLLGFLMISHRWRSRGTVRTGSFFNRWFGYSLNKRQIFSLFVLAVLSIYLTNALEFWGLQYLSAAKTCFLYSLSPFFAPLFSYLHFKEKMNIQKWIGLCIGFVGFLPVLLTQTGSEELFHAVGFLSWPTLALMGAVLCSVYGWVILRLVVKGDEISPLMANGSSMFIGGICAFTHSFFVESWNPVPVDPNHVGAFLKSTLVMTLLFNVICYNLYGALLKRFTATFLSFVGLLSPLFASFNAWLFLGEPLSWVIFLSTGIISLGLWIVYRAELKQGYIHQSKVETSG